MNFSSTISLLLFGCFFGVTKALLCYKCVTLDCPADKINCEDVRNFIVRELRTYYYMDNYLPPCPKVNETLEWKYLQLNNVNCGELASGQATCSLGRMKIISTKSPENEGENGQVVSHATVLGCANTKLLTQVRDTLKSKHECDMQSINGTLDSTRHYVSMEHCSQPSDQCHNVDYCLSPMESIVKTFKENIQDTKFEFGIVVAIVVLIVVIFGAVVLGGMCRSPINRASNLPSCDEIDFLSTQAVTPLPHDTQTPCSSSQLPKFLTANSGRPNPNSRSTDIY